MKYINLSSLFFRRVLKFGFVLPILILFLCFKDCFNMAVPPNDLEVKTEDSLKQVIQEIPEEKTPISVIPVPLLSLQDPQVRFVNKLTDIADKYGLIKSNACFISISNDIDYPFIVWDEVPGAVKYEVYRKYEGQKYVKINYDSPESSSSSYRDPIVRNSNAQTDGCLTELNKVIKTPYYYYADRSLSPEELDEKNILDERRVIRKYTYQIKAIDSNGNRADSNEISITMVPTSAKQAFNDIFKNNLSDLLYHTHGFRVVNASSRTQKGISSGKYTRSVTRKSPYTYTYSNYSNYKGAIVVDGTLTGNSNSSSVRENSTMTISGTLSITGPYRATVTFNNLEMYLKGKLVASGDSLDQLGNSGTVSIVYNTPNGEEDTYTYDISNNDQRSTLENIINVQPAVDFIS